MALTIRNFTVKDSVDVFEIKRKIYFQDGKQKIGNHIISFAESNLTAFEARKLAAWILKAADFCDKENGVKK